MNREDKRTTAPEASPPEEATPQTEAAQSRSAEAPSETGQRQPPQVTITKRASKSRPVTVYLVILFLVALLLLIMSFFMQRRSSETLASLNESMSASQDLVTLQLETQRLTHDLENAQKELEAASKTNDDLTKQVETLEKQTQALEWLRQIEAATRRSYPQAMELIEEFEDSDLPQYLPDESAVEGEASPAEAYRQLYAALY